MASLSTNHIEAIWKSNKTRFMLRSDRQWMEWMEWMDVGWTLVLLRDDLWMLLLSALFQGSSVAVYQNLFFEPLQDSLRVLWRVLSDRFTIFWDSFRLFLRDYSRELFDNLEFSYSDIFQDIWTDWRMNTFMLSSIAHSQLETSQRWSKSSQLI